MSLKDYQRQSLDALRAFLEAARLQGAKAAFEAATPRRYRPLDGLPDTPAICLRLPTGGGKTLLAAHSIAVARDAWLERDFPFVLWLVPSAAIATQTVEALRNPRLLPRAALDEAFGRKVRIFAIDDFADIRPQDVEGNVTVVVSTIQSFRVRDTGDRNVYSHNEDMEPHFGRLPRPWPEGLERDAQGQVKYSFANLLHIHRPLMVVDEAHNAMTGLSREMQARLNPSAIFEFTATPRAGSNLLHRVGAEALKAEEMVKLPIRLAEHTEWRLAVNAAVRERARLADLASAEPGGVRPIALYQAQPAGGEVTVDILRRHLIEAEQVPEGRIAVATGTQRELDDVDLMDPACPIEHVITIQALKEGWDCPFAYVLCSVTPARSATSIEQLLGRVMRMPFAKKRVHPDLNIAYCHLPAATWTEGALALKDKLVQMGFEEREAEDAIEAPVQQNLDPGGLWEAQLPLHAIEINVSPEARERLAAQPGVRLEEREGRTILTLRSVAPEVEELLASAAPEAASVIAQSFRAYRAQRADKLSPAQRGEVLRVPAIATRIQGDLFRVERDLLLEDSEWSLSDHPARLDAFVAQDGPATFTLDVEGGRVVWNSAAGQMDLGFAPAEWSEARLANWLSDQLQAPEFTPAERSAWVAPALARLRNQGGVALADMMRWKYLLARLLRDQVEKARAKERASAYQTLLFRPEAPPVIDIAAGWTFREGMFDDAPRHRPGWRPQKHFLTHVPAFDGAEDGEEERCAQALESLPQVRHWVRNVDKHRNAFWMPLAEIKFYPDFVAQLEDGRLLVAEYKGAHLATNAETAAKTAVGELWARLSGNVFAMVVKRDDTGRDPRAQLLAALR